MSSAEEKGVLEILANTSRHEKPMEAEEWEK